MTGDDCWDGVSLNWGRILVATELDVLKHDWVETSMFELKER